MREAPPDIPEWSDRCRDHRCCCCGIPKTLQSILRDLYSNNKIQDLSIVILPNKYKIGPYIRDGLIVFSYLHENMDMIIHALAHEIGHSYAKGADCFTWEDWLNETHAEWSALLYELKYNSELFEQLLNKQKLKYKGDYRIRTKDNSRPGDVHVVGTLVYYDLYLKYGKETIIFLLKVFDQLDNKNTEEFFNVIKQKNKVIYEELMCKI